jgi:hypothetical protein
VVGDQLHGTLTPIGDSADASPAEPEPVPEPVPEPTPLNVDRYRQDVHLAPGNKITVQFGPQDLDKELLIDLLRHDDYDSKERPLRFNFRGKSSGNYVDINEKIIRDNGETKWGKSYKYYPKEGNMDDLFKDGATVEIEFKDQGVQLKINGKNVNDGPDFEEKGDKRELGNWSYMDVLDLGNLPRFSIIDKIGKNIQHVNVE